MMKEHGNCLSKGSSQAMDFYGHLGSHNALVDANFDPLNMN